MVKRDIVVIGASAGGVEALTQVVAGLPPDTAAALFVTLHVSQHSLLPEILGRRTTLPVAHARNGDEIARGRIYVAPPGEHMLVEHGRVALSRSARENGHRPALDPLFRSAARAYRTRVLGVVLSGQLDDGAAGLFAIKSRGGLAMVQDPATAVAPSMPNTALRYTDVDYVLPPAEIGPAIAKLAAGVRVQRGRRPARKRVGGNGRARGRRLAQTRGIAPFVCPDCQGPLYQSDGRSLVQWTCEVGHRFSPLSLDQAQQDALERALWIAARALRERVLSEPFIAEQSGGALPWPARGALYERAQAAERDLEILREILDRI